MCLAGVTFSITIAFVLAAGLALLSLRLSHGPVSLGLLKQPVLHALSARVQPGLQVAIDGVDLEALDGKPAIALDQMVVRDSGGKPIFRAPHAVVSFDPLHLLTGSVAPTRLDVRNVVLRLLILPDGSAALSAGTDDEAPLRISDALASMSGPDAATSSVDAASAGTVPAGANVAPTQRLAQALAGLIDRFSDADKGLGGFTRFGVTDGTLILDDRTRGTVTSFGDLDLRFQKQESTRSVLTLAADGAQGRWSIRVEASVGPGGARDMSIAADGVTLDDLRALPALSDAGVDSDLDLSIDLSLSTDAAGRLTAASGRLGTGAGFLHMHDPDHEPLFLKETNAAFHLDAPSGVILVDTVAIEAETARYNLTGRVAPPTSDTQPWTLQMTGSGVFGAERPGERPLALDAIDIAARVATDPKHIALDHLRLHGPEVDLDVGLDITGTSESLLVKGSARSGRMPAQAMLRLWPTTMAADVRAWLLVNLQGGIVEKGAITFALDDNDLAKMKALRSVADSHLRVDYAVSDVTLAFMEGVPPLRKVVGRGSVTGDTSQFLVDSGAIEVAPGQALAMSAGSLTVPSTDLKPAPATIAAHVSGGVDTLVNLLSRDALKPYAEIPGDLSKARGQIDGDLSVALKIGKGANSKDVRIGANAAIQGLTVEKLVGKHSLTDGAIALVVDKAGLRIKGDAKILGASTQIDVKKPSGTAPGEASATLVLDDAARVKAGMALGKALTGPVTAKVSMALGEGDNRSAAVDLDLGKAAINNLIPGLSKPAGKPGRVTASVTPNADGVALDTIVCDVGSFSARGSAVLNGEGSLQSAKLSQVRLSPGDDMKVDVVGGDALKVTVHGANIDVRPFLKNLSGGDGSDQGVKALDLELHASVLTGQNSQALTNVDLRLGKRDGQVKRLQLDARFGRAPFTIRSSQQGRDTVLDAVSGDAGATLAFLDLYKKVGGGKLDATIRMAEAKFEGYATVHDFILRDDTAMKRLTEESIQQERKGNVQIDPANLRFTKLYVIFSKAGSRLNVKDGGMFGPQMGATVQGWLDLAANKIQLGGTFVPAYGVNNLFSQIPVFGPLLGGGTHEGLFGINFRLSGAVDSPNLTVDPLSALAPGFLRKIFGAITDAAQENAAPTPGQAQVVPDSVAQ